MSSDEPALVPIPNRGSNRPTVSNTDRRNAMLQPINRSMIWVSDEMAQRSGKGLVQNGRSLTSSRSTRPPRTSKEASLWNSRRIVRGHVRSTRQSSSVKATRGLAVCARPQFRAKDSQAWGSKQYLKGIFPRRTTASTACSVWSRDPLSTTSMSQLSCGGNTVSRLARHRASLSARFCVQIIMLNSGNTISTYNSKSCGRFGKL